jgi:hypothetical protein
VKSNRYAPPKASLLLIALAALTLGACGHDIGDNCLSSADCDPNGTRACDLSQPGGYCTIVGCDETTCPSNSACIRYFPQKFLTKPCTPGLNGEGCDADEVCLDPDPTAPNNPGDGMGLCAKRTSEQRQCAKTCSNNSDCRGGYQCRKSGTGGALLLSTNPTATTSFCSPLP